MDLCGATLRAGTTSYPLESCAIQSVDARNAEVKGQFSLRGGARLARGYGKLVIEAQHAFEVRLLASATSSNGERHYRFVAGCDPRVAPLLDLMMNAVKHPTLLENAMR